jgi:hypothetical protein
MRTLPILKTRRVLRGGSWNNTPQNLRSANRNRNAPDNRNNNTGFRIASTAPGPERACSAQRTACQGAVQGCAAQCLDARPPWLQFGAAGASSALPVPQCHG